MKKGVTLLIICALLVFSISFVSAAVLNVCPSCSYTTIQSAINTASAGDIVNVSAGTYTAANLNWDGNGFLRINKSITLKGAGSANTIIDGQHSHSVISGHDGIHSTCLWVESSDITLEGLTIKGCDWGIRVSDWHAPTAIEISNLKFNDVTITDNYGHGVIFESADGVIFKRVKFTNCNANGNGDRGIYISPASNAEDFTLLNTNANDNLKAGFNCQGTLNKLNITGGTFNNNSGGENYEGHGLYFGVGIELDGCTNVKINNVEANKNGLLGPSDCNDAMNGGAGILLKDNTSNVQILNSKLRDNANGILIEWCALWPTGSQPTNINAHLNDIENNNYFGISNRAPSLILNAENNWWGDCSGPSGIGTGSGDAVSANVDFNPWLGACIKNKTTSQSCVLAADSVTLYANVSSLVCVGNVIFSVNKNGTWQNYTGIGSGNGIYSVTISGLTGNRSVSWTVYADDCYNHITKDGDESFYVNRRTTLTTNPNLPDGLNNWYVSHPIFTLTNPDAPQMLYKWDGTGTHIYSSPFNLSDIPNPPPETAGILKLTYWGNLSCNRIEQEQSQTLYVDLMSPIVESLTPADGAVITNKNPLISAIINDIYGENSRVNKDSISMKLDGINITGSIIKQDLTSAKVRVIYNAINLSEILHLVELSGMDNAGNDFYKSWSFFINVSSGFVLNLNSPEAKNYSAKSILLNVSASSLVAKIEYQDLDGWKTLCTKCKDYSRKLTFSEGNHILTVRATDIYGNSNQKNVLFFVDSVLPKISKIDPANNKIVNGSRFYIKYSEDNLKSITLFYGNLSATLSCLPGKNQECETNVNLGGYNGQYINYWFVVADGLRNVSSRVNRIKIDTAIPVLSVNLPGNANYSRRVQFNITISEKVKLGYYDNSVLSPRWTSLCSDCSSYSQTKIFSAGTHNVLIRVTDKAGNSAQENRIFTII